MASRGLYGLSKHLYSILFFRTTKVQLYNTLIVPELIYGNEARTLTDSDLRGKYSEPFMAPPVLMVSEVHATTMIHRLTILK